MSVIKKVELDKIILDSIKKLLKDIESPIIPLALIFEELGFKGVTGTDWGILAGAVCALAIEFGYNVQKVGRSIILIQRKQGLTNQ